MNMTILIAIWAAMAVVVAILAAYRLFIGRREEDTVHLAESEIGEIAEQSQIARRIDWADRWGKILTAVTVVYGVVLAVVYIYRAFTDTSIRFE